MNTLTTLLKFNIQWYGSVMRDILFRYKIIALFFILLISPTLSSLFNLVTLPLESLFLYPVKNVTTLCASLFLYQIFGVIWISIQYKILFQQPWQKYLVTLQLSNIQKKLTDIILLIFVDSIMWAPLFLSGIRSIFDSTFSFLSILLIITKCIVFISLILLEQMILIKSKYYIWIAASIINLFFVFFATSFTQLSQLIPMIILIFIIYFLISNCYENKIKRSHIKKNKSSVHIKKINYKKPMPVLRVQVKNLIGHSSQLTILLSVMLIFSLSAILCIVYGKTNPALPFILSTVILINSLSASNIFKRAHTQWDEFSGYLLSLPISKILLFRNTLMISSVIAILFNIPIILAAEFLSEKNLVFKIIIAFFLSIVFLNASYTIQIRLRRLGFFYSFCLMFIFLYVNYLLI